MPGHLQGYDLLESSRADISDDYAVSARVLGGIECVVGLSVKRVERPIRYALRDPNAGGDPESGCNCIKIALRQFGFYRFAKPTKVLASKPTHAHDELFSAKPANMAGISRFKRLQFATYSY